MTAAGKEARGGMKGGQGIHQRTFMHKACTQSRIWGLAWQEQRVRLRGGGEREKRGQ